MVDWSSGDEDELYLVHPNIAAELDGDHKMVTLDHQAARCPRKRAKVAVPACLPSIAGEFDIGRYQYNDTDRGNCQGAAMRGFLAIFVAAAFLAGCASGPTGGEVLTGSVRSSAARLVIYRAAVVGFAVQPNYVIDGKVIAGSQPAGFVMCDLPPGRHEVAVANLPLSNNLFGHGSEKMTVDLRPGHTAYLSAEPQVGILTPGQITLMQVTETQGRSDVATLHRTSSVCGKT